MEATTIDLSLFCDSEVMRYDLSKPFTIDGWRYATDAKICVRVPTDDPSDELKANDLHGRFPDCRTLPWPDAKTRDTLAWMPMPPVPPEAWEVCPCCEGSKVDPDFKDEECDFCEGEGRFIKPQDITLSDGETRIGDEPARKMERLPNLRLAVIGKYLFFDFDGGEGLLATLIVETPTPMTTGEESGK